MSRHHVAKHALRTFPAAPVRRDHLDTQFQERFVEWIGVVGAVPDELRRQLS